METLLVAGSYGVGKSTLCKEISKLTKIPFFSAGDLIGNVVGEDYSRDKKIKNISNNQNVLSYQVKELLLVHKKIILAGHFCVYNSNSEICLINDDLFSNLYISKILLLEAPAKVIFEHLLIRDKCEYDVKQLDTLLNYERKQATNVSKLINVDIIYYQMKYDGKDVNRCVKQLFDLNENNGIIE